MQEPKQPKKTNIELEDLLQLKRAERPQPEFWNQFEVELQQRRLQALLKRDYAFTRWWRSVTEWMNPALPLTASAAVVALVAAFVSLPQQAVVVHTNAPAISPSVQPTQAVESNAFIRPSAVDTHFVVESYSSSPASTGNYTSVAANTELSASSGAGVYYVSGQLEGQPAAHRTIY